MNDDGSVSTLKKIAQAGQKRHAARAMTAARALRLTLAKLAEADLELAVGVIGLTEGRIEGAEGLPEVDDTSLLLFLEAPMRGGGAAILDAALVGALVQQQTMGTVTELPADAPARKSTRTDASLIAPFLDSLFKKLCTAPESEAERRLFEGVCFGAHMTELRLLKLAMEADEYVHFGITIDIAGGTRQGRMDFYLPQIAAEEPARQPGEDMPQVPTSTLERAVLDLPAQLQVSLFRARLTLAELADLSPGDAIPLPEGVLEKTEIMSISGKVVATGKLGQIGGLRAVKMLNRDAPSKRVMDELPHKTQAGGGAIGALDGLDADMARALDATDQDWPEIDYGEDLPDIAASGGPGDLPDLPELPALPDIPGEASGLPDLPDIPGEDGLPDLPDIPELVKEA